MSAHSSRLAGALLTVLMAVAIPALAEYDALAIREICTTADQCKIYVKYGAWQFANTSAILELTASELSDVQARIAKCPTIPADEVKQPVIPANAMKHISSEYTYIFDFSKRDHYVVEVRCRSGFLELRSNGGGVGYLRDVGGVQDWIHGKAFMGRRRASNVVYIDDDFGTCWSIFACTIWAGKDSYWRLGDNEFRALNDQIDQAVKSFSKSLRTDVEANRKRGLYPVFRPDPDTPVNSQYEFDCKVLMTLWYEHLRDHFPELHRLAWAPKDAGKTD